MSKQRSMSSYMRIATRSLLLISSIIIIILLFPKEGKFRYEFSEGKPWRHNDLIAPFDFAINKSVKEIEKEQEQVKLSQPYYFRLDSAVKKKKKREFEKLITNNRFLRNILNNKKMRIAHNLGMGLLDSVYNQGYVGETKLPDAMSNNHIVMILNGNVAIESRAGNLMNRTEVNKIIGIYLERYPDIDSAHFVYAIGKSLAQNIEYDSSLTNTEMRVRLSEISTIRGMVQKDERIIAKGELVNNVKFQILLSLKEQYEAQLGGTAHYYGIMTGQIILVTLALVVLMLFQLFFRKDVWVSLRKNLLISIVILLMVSITAFTVRQNIDWLYLVPLCLAPIIIRVFFDTYMAIFVHIITVILIGFLVPNSFEYVFFQLIAGIVTIVSVKDLQKRSQFFLTSIYIFVTYSLLTVGMTLVQQGSLADINTLNMAMFGGSALLTLFAYPFIYIIEKVFGMITDISLLEYSDTNSKLLRELASQAPGTFQHSIQVANLAEEAIRSIGGNPLLTRAGALYHDIGKMTKPVYFTENQQPGNNPHDDLDYKESVNILRGHVKGGIEMAKKHNLPPQIIDFIKSHHGTKKAEYFYLKYKQEHPEELIDEKNFCYPGPEPRTKETAVVMMADTVEAASRSMKEPDFEKISTLVDTLIDKQLAENQYSYSEITLGEITRVKELFKKRLMNIHHIRIEYPEEKKQDR